MPEAVSITVNGRPVAAPSGSTVAVALAMAGQFCRTSVTGEPRGPLCGMGICFECRVTIDGRSQCKSCQVICRSGMDVHTQE